MIRNKKDQKEIQTQALKLIQDSESNSNVYQHLREKLSETNAQVMSKVNTKKVESHFSRKFTAKQRELVNHLCQQMREKLDVPLERQTKNFLNNRKVNENLKVLDYLNGRSQIMSQINKNPFEWYDEEEHYLDDMHEILTEYLKRS